MHRLAYDSDVIDDIPAGAPIALSYADLVTTAAALADYRRRWPVFELIDRGLGDPLGAASIWDVETGALTVADLPGRYAEAHRRGIKGKTVYASEHHELWTEIEHALGGAGYYRWVAMLNGSWAASIGYHVDLAQFAGADLTGGHYDASIVWTDSWHPRTAAAPPAPSWLPGARASADQVAQEAAQLAKILRSA